ncbi:MAG: chemotaxis signal transduction protein [Deltaproteobacteria bacterium]|nr:chemotaxis signal transduction protein [Deltaproteobacteria bacterium]
MADQLGENKDAGEGSIKDRFLTFLLGEELFGVELSQVMEIGGLQPITEIPVTPEYVKGVANLRGNIIPFMDARLRLKKPPAEYDDRTCVIVIAIGGGSVGLIVDGVSEVLAIPREDIANNPERNSGNGGYVKNIGKLGSKVILLLDCEKLLSTGGHRAVRDSPQ